MARLHVDSLFPPPAELFTSGDGVRVCAVSSLFFDGTMLEMERNSSKILLHKRGTWSLHAQRRGRGSERGEGVYTCAGICSLLGVRFSLFVTAVDLVGHLMGSPLFVCREVTPVCLDPRMERAEARRATRQECLELLCRKLSDGTHFFALGYDLSISLQQTVRRRRLVPDHEKSADSERKYVWNENLMRDLLKNRAYPWWTPIIQGYVGTGVVNLCGKKLEIATIARRDKRWGGPRLHCRGLNGQGHASNFVEVEQIISWHNENGGFIEATSHLQLRGSAPILWSQARDPFRISPPIEIGADFDVSAAALDRHLNEIEQGFEHGVILLNLISKKGEQGELGKTVESVLQKLFADKRKQRQLERRKLRRRAARTTAAALGRRGRAAGEDGDGESDEESDFSEMRQDEMGEGLLGTGLLRSRDSLWFDFNAMTKKPLGVAEGLRLLFAKRSKTFALSHGGGTEGGERDYGLGASRLSASGRTEGGAGGGGGLLVPCEEGRPGEYSGSGLGDLLDAFGFLHVHIPVARWGFDSGSESEGEQSSSDEAPSVGSFGMGEEGGNYSDRGGGGEWVAEVASEASWTKIERRQKGESSSPSPCTSPRRREESAPRSAEEEEEKSERKKRNREQDVGEERTGRTGRSRRTKRKAGMSQRKQKRPPGQAEGGPVWAFVQVRSEQTGVVRTNCVDSVDRTAIVQTAVGRRMARAQIGELLAVSGPLRNQFISALLDFDASPTTPLPSACAARTFLPPSALSTAPPQSAASESEGGVGGGGSEELEEDSLEEFSDCQETQRDREHEGQSVSFEDRWKHSSKGRGSREKETPWEVWSRSCRQVRGRLWRRPLTLVANDNDEIFGLLWTECGDAVAMSYVGTGTVKRRNSLYMRQALTLSSLSEASSSSGALYGGDKDRIMRRGKIDSREKAEALLRDAIVVLCRHWVSVTSSGVLCDQNWLLTEGTVQEVPFSLRVKMGLWARAGLGLRFGIAQGLLQVVAVEFPLLVLLFCLTLPWGLGRRTLAWGLSLNIRAAVWLLTFVTRTLETFLLSPVVGWVRRALRVDRWGGEVAGFFATSAKMLLQGGRGIFVRTLSDIATATEEFSPGFAHQVSELAYLFEVSIDVTEVGVEGVEQLGRWTLQGVWIAGLELCAAVVASLRSGRAATGLVTAIGWTLGSSWFLFEMGLLLLLYCWVRRGRLSDQSWLNRGVH